MITKKYSGHIKQVTSDCLKCVKSVGQQTTVQSRLAIPQ